jgi:Transposase DDE domain group 1
LSGVAYTENRQDARSFKCPEVVPSAVEKGFDQEMEDTRTPGSEKTSANSQLRILSAIGNMKRKGVAYSSTIERHRQRLHGRARRTIDMDPTDDPTHGQQQFTFFNRHYDSYCYLPVCFLTFNEEAEQYLVAAVLRRGNATGSLRWIIPGFRMAWHERQVFFTTESTIDRALKV